MNLSLQIKLLEELKRNVMTELSSMDARLKDETDFQEKVKNLEKRISQDVLLRSNMERESIVRAKEVGRVEDETDAAPEVVYVKD